LRKLALKKLKPSDLSLFKSYLTNHPQAKQKGFNLDLSVIEKVFFPSLRASLEPLSKRAAHVDLTMYGPGMAGAHTLARKVKRDAKNIRLNGEIIDSPVTDPDRYDILAPGDFAVMEFVGAALPTAVNVVLVAAGSPEDATLHTKFASLLPSAADSMKVLSENQLEDAIKDAAPSISHPIRDWLDATLLEEVALGSSEAVETLNKSRPGRGLSPSDLKAAKDSAERTGRLGEELLDQYLKSPGFSGVTGHEWVAQVNAVSPFDFSLKMEDGSERHADAKSTSGKFSAPIYLSVGEIKHALSSGVPYDIFRLYEITESSALLRVARDIGPQVAPVYKALSEMPPGVKVDSLSFDPSFFEFAPDVFEVEVPEEDEESE